MKKMEKMLGYLSQPCRKKIDFKQLNPFVDRTSSSIFKRPIFETAPLEICDSPVVVCLNLMERSGVGSVDLHNHYRPVYLNLYGALITCVSLLDSRDLFQSVSDFFDPSMNDKQWLLEVLRWPDIESPSNRYLYLCGLQNILKTVRESEGDEGPEICLRFINSILRLTAAHEAGHLLLIEAGMHMRNGKEAEERRAYFFQTAFGDSGLSLSSMLHSLFNEGREPHHLARMAILSEIKGNLAVPENEDGILADRFVVTSNRLRVFARQALDGDMSKTFGKTLSDIVPEELFENIAKHEFLTKEHIPLLEILLGR
jgi:hypothetical protein